MIKIKKHLSALLCLVIILSALFIVPIISANSDYEADLVSIVSNYNIKELPNSRIIVADYSGNTYNAVQTAIDEKNNFAVLQYKNELDAKLAYDKIISDGHIADFDGSVEVSTFDKLQMHPQASEKLGLTHFFDNYKIGYDDVVVAIVDTGVLLDHPELEGRLYSDGIDYSADGFDTAVVAKDATGTNYHATAVSSIIANNTSENVKILPIKIFDKNMESSTVLIMSAMNKAIDMGVDVINVSVETEYGKSTFESIVKRATEKGICVCASAGNDTAECDELYPAGTPNVITVSAMNSSFSSIASYSNFGSSIDFCAPGSKINTASINEDGTAGYSVYSGTSFAAPYITSLCADIKSMNSKMTKQDVYNILKNNCVDYGDEGYDVVYGYGMPNISSICYENDDYSLYLPQGELNIKNSANYTVNNRPWNNFCNKIISVNAAENISSVGDYEFYNMPNAVFNGFGELDSIGTNAFNGCKMLNSINLSIEIKKIGANAFSNVSDSFVINGYRNTLAESYAKSNSFAFEALGCNHNYAMEIIEPTMEQDGYTIYTCTVCNDSYIGAYVEPTVILSGQCGDKVEFELFNTGRLKLFGSGEMYSYFEEKAPWNEYKNSIRTVSVYDDVSYISPFAFSECRNIINFDTFGNELVSVDKCVYSSDMSRLVLCYTDEYEMPNTVTNFDASAFLLKNSSIEFNDNFYVDDDLVYDLDQNIIMALSSYNNDNLTITDDISVNSYAFILTSYPNSARVYSLTAELCDYSIGFSYENGSIYKNDIVIRSYVDDTAYIYANKYGFDFSLLNTGSCGDNITWYFNTKTKELKLQGSGDMTVYRSNSSVPWYDYMAEIETVTIDNDITSLSIYSFFNANNIKNVVMPLSLDFSRSQTIWLGCGNIETIRLTLGTGYVPDYTNSNFSYTPWYKSKKNLKNLIISSDVKYIGNNAFRNCPAVKILTLTDCEKIGTRAFNGCSNLNLFINYSHQTEYGIDVFSDNIATVYAYDDSTTRDLCNSLNNEYISLGCTHSRDLIVVSDLNNCCFDTEVSYLCSDCDYECYSEFKIAQSNGHYIKALVQNADLKPIQNADVYCDGVLTAKTNMYGRFVIDSVKCNTTHLIEIKVHNIVIASSYVDTNGANRFGNVVLTYGDFVNDGVVNAKDYAYAINNNYDDVDLFNFSKVDNQNQIDTAYLVQDLPMATTVYNEQSPDVYYRREFYAEFQLGKDFDIKEYGFIYGKNMDNDFMTLDNVGKNNVDGYSLKKYVIDPKTDYTGIAYGASDMKGKVSARFYIVYSNGVKTFNYYSDVSSYTYN